MKDMMINARSVIIVQALLMCMHCGMQSVVLWSEVDLTAASCTPLHVFLLSCSFVTQLIM